MFEKTSSLKWNKSSKGIEGGISGLALGVVIGIVALFIGLFMITKVSDITAIKNTSDFYGTYISLTSNVSTIYDVLILVIIIISLSVAIAVLKGFAGDKNISPGDPL